MSFTLVNFDDWQTLYDDEGAKVVESDELTAAEIVRAMGGRVRFASEIFSMEASMEGTPDHLREFPEYAFTQ